MAQVFVDCAALRSDAKKWDGASTAMHNAASAAQNLVLTATQFGDAAEVRGLASAYAALQKRLVGLLKGGEAEFDKIAGALRRVANEYEHDDSTGAEGLDRIGR